MKDLRNLLAGAALAAAALIASLAPSQAFQASLCAPEAAGTGPMARRVVNPNTSTGYQLNSAGCAVFAQADVGYFITQGYTPGPTQNSILYNTGSLPSSGTTDIPIGSIPAGNYIQHIIVENKTASAVTGGLAFGTTANATDIVTALTCGASCLTYVTDANLKLRVFSTTAAQVIHMAPVTSSNSANLNVTVVYAPF